MSLNLREQLHTEMKLFHTYKAVHPHKVAIVVGQLYIAAGQLYIAAGQIYIAAGWLYILQQDDYDLMSDKYITSLLLIKMLKAFLRVIIKS